MLFVRCFCYVVVVCLVFGSCLFVVCSLFMRLLFSRFVSVYGLRFSLVGFMLFCVFCFLFAFCSCMFSCVGLFCVCCLCFLLFCVLSLFVLCVCVCVCV